MRRRGRFVDLAERQLDLFQRDHAGLIADCEAALRAYDRAERDEAEERYGDYLDLVETAQDELEALRDTYARTLDDDGAVEYRDVLKARDSKRLARIGLELV